MPNITYTTNTVDAIISGSGTSIPTNTIYIDPIDWNNATYTDWKNMIMTNLEKNSKPPIEKSESLPSYDFEYIKQIVPEKVYEFTFHDGIKVKTIREEDDPFDLEYMFYLAIAKKLYSKDYTFDGVLYKTYQLDLEKKYVKAVKKGIKLFNTLQKEKQKKEEYDEMKKRQHQKFIEKKKAAKRRKRKDQINIIAEAIRLSKEEG